MFELIEIDPQTGEEDHLIETGTFAKLSRSLRELLADIEDEWDTYDQPWSWCMIRPVA